MTSAEGTIDIDTTAIGAICVQWARCVQNPEAANVFNELYSGQLLSGYLGAVIQSRT